MNPTVWLIAMPVIGYVLGSIPHGLIVVYLFTGKDIRKEHSGRTGGTNAARVGGRWPGIITTILDGLKGAVAVWLAQWLLAGQPLQPWGEVLAGVAAVLGHNYSMFLPERKTDETGRTYFKLGGGAGGATSTGASVGLWGWNLFIVPVVGLGVLFGLGYASVATLSAGLTITLVMLLRWLIAGTSPVYMLYGLGVFVLQVIALRPNIKRLMRGEERLIGWRAKRRAARLAAQAEQPQADSGARS